MKKLILIYILGFMTFSIGAFAQIKVASNGYVGINQITPGYRLDVSGDCRFGSSNSIVYNSSGQLTPLSGYSSLGTYTSNWTDLYAYNAHFYNSPTYYSDKKLKTDIRDIDSTGNKLLLLKPVKYKMIPKLNGNQKTDSIMTEMSKVDQIGFIAQDVQKVFPELVNQDPQGTLGIKYVEFIPLIIKAYQEQQLQIEELKLQVKKLEGKK